MMPNRLTRVGKRRPGPVPILLLAPVALVLALSTLSDGPQANTCIAPPPLRISGALCGRITDPTGAATPDIELRVVDEHAAVIATARSNSNGDFKFPLLPKGSFRVTTTAAGFMDYIGQIEILRPNQASCRRPTSVELGLTSCSGGIFKNRPQNFHEPGW